jgi:hypothetical protein
MNADRHLVSHRVALCLSLLHTDQQQAGREAFELLALDDFAIVPSDTVWFCCMCLLAEACAMLEDGQRACVLYDALFPLPHALCQGRLDRRLLGLRRAVPWHAASTIGNFDTAVKHYETAAARNTAAGIHHRTAQANAAARSVTTRLSAASNA